MPYIQERSNLDKCTHFESICKRHSHSKGLITIISNHLITSPKAEPPSYVVKWERNLGFHLEATEWDKIWATTKSSSQHITALETNYKVLTHWYFGTVWLQKLFGKMFFLCSQHHLKNISFLTLQLHF